MGVKKPVPEGINEYIFNQIKTHQNIPQSFHTEDIIRGNLLCKFLSCTSIEERFNLSFRIFKKVLSRHAKNQPFYEVLKYAGKIESGIQIFNPTLRDHLTHSVYVYLLGLSVLPPQFHNRFDLQEENIGFQWKLASLLHDVGSPPSLLCYSMKSYLDRLQKDSTFDFFYPKISIQNLETLHKRPRSPNNSFTLIERKLTEWDIDFDIREEFKKGLKKGDIDHGILGALLVLKIIDDKYCQNNPNHYVHENEFIENEREKEAWSRHFFDDDVVAAATAISVHNIIDRTDSIIKFEKTPILYLLILADTLQEWDRYSPKARMSDPYALSIQFEGEQLNADLHLSNRKKQSIQMTLKKLLINDGPEIVVR